MTISFLIGILIGFIGGFIIGAGFAIAGFFFFWHEDMMKEDQRSAGYGRRDSRLSSSL